MIRHYLFLLKSKMSESTVKNFLSLIKFSHTIFALPFAMIGFGLAMRFSVFEFDIWLLLKVIACMVFARSAAMAFNRYIDRDIDAANERTASVREIPKGLIQPKQALGFVIVNALLFVLTTYFINSLCFYLSPIALVVILGYSYTKRFTALCHLILGIGLALAPIGAYLAVTSSFAYLPVYFSFAVLFWVAGFDMIYALQDVEVDQSLKLYSMPSRIGKRNALLLSKFFHLLCFVFLALAGWHANFTLLYWVGLGVFTSLLIYQHTLVKADDLSKVNLAFFTTNGVASVLFSIFVLLSLFL